MFLRGPKTPEPRTTLRGDSAKQKRSTKSQVPNSKKTPMINISNPERNRLGHFGLVVGNYLGIWIWNLGFLLMGLLCLILVLSINMGCQRSKAGITVAGSTSVEPFAELLSEEYMSLHPGSRIYVHGGGSSAGIEAVRSLAAH